MAKGKKGKTENISISLPGNLIDLLDSACDRYDFTRSNLMKRALKKYLAQKYANSPEFWDEAYQRFIDSSS